MADSLWVMECGGPRMPHGVCPRQRPLTAEPLRLERQRRVQEQGWAPRAGGITPGFPPAGLQSKDGISVAGECDFLDQGHEIHSGEKGRLIYPFSTRSAQLQTGVPSLVWR